MLLLIFGVKEWPNTHSNLSIRHSYTRFFFRDLFENFVELVALEDRPEDETVYSDFLHGCTTENRDSKKHAGKVGETECRDDNADEAVQVLIVLVQEDSDRVDDDGNRNQEKER